MTAWQSVPVHIARLRAPALQDVEERSHGAIFAPKKEQGRLDPLLTVGRVMIQIDTRRGPIILADRMTRRGIAVAATIFVRSNFASTV